MVYESDFYTTRRPYSSRPNVSSYSVTSRIVTIPSIRTVHTYTTLPIYSNYPTVRHRSIPFVAHKRLVTGTRISSSPLRFSTRVVSLPSFRSVTPIRFTTPIRYPITSIGVWSSPSRYVRSYTTRISTSPARTLFSVRPSILNREYKRIENKVRCHPDNLYTDNFLNSNVVRDFDDETKQIRNDSNKLMRKIHTRVQRAQSVLPISYSAKYERRYGPDSFVSHISSPLKSTICNGLDSYNPNQYIGKSHLASVRIVGNKAYNTRRATSYYDDDKVRNDVNLLSFYLKNRKAAADKSEPAVKLESSKLDPLRPSRKFSQPKAEECDDELKEKRAARAQRLLALADLVEGDRWEKKKTQAAAQISEERPAEENRRIEAERLAEEKHLIEAKRLAEEERLIESERLAEEKRLIEAKRLAKEKRRIEAEKLAEEQRLIEAERLAEEERRIEAERLAEEKRIEAERLAEEERRIEAERLAEEQRIEAERLAEEERLIEAERLAEEERLMEDERLAEEERLIVAKALAEEQAQSENEDEIEEDSPQEIDDELTAEERRLQADAILREEQKQRESEMARLSELEKIAEEEREAEIARQAAELTEIARQQDAEARKLQEQDETQSTASEGEQVQNEESGDAFWEQNDDIERTEDASRDVAIDTNEEDANNHENEPSEADDESEEELTE